MKQPKKTTGKKLGRPAKFAGERTRGALTIRLRDKVRDGLEMAAQSAGRSLSEEIEYRIELSLARRDYLVEQWGHDVFNIADVAARSLSFIEQHTGKLWAVDEETFELFSNTLLQLLKNYRDVVLVNRRDTPSGALEGKTKAELAEMFAGMGGISPPRRLEKEDPEVEAARRRDSANRYVVSIRKRTED